MGPDPALPPAEQEAAADGSLLPDDWSDMNPSWGWTAGSVISTANDLAAFVEALVDGGLLTPEMQQTRLQSIQPVDPANEAFGYGMGLMRFNTYYGHNGQIPGYNSFMVRDPDTGTSIIVLTALTSAPDGRAPADRFALAVIAELASAAGTASVADDLGRWSGTDDELLATSLVAPATRREQHDAEHDRRDERGVGDGRIGPNLRHDGNRST